MRAVRLDVTDPAAARAAVATAVAEFGHIIQVSSVGGRITTPGMSAYEPTVGQVDDATQADIDPMAALR